ncbi:MAG: hypothetical protein CVU54_13945 [Deltaproteobacteria bacterium HGW-Deltaproteobacteria-12]|jgi:hypothetical protein|nr:MAG: hypothetical protein CVU54_13945 [Deltaproteobacteria bacterium HGW-Deltaproteobacteria-12]
MDNGQVFFGKMENDGSAYPLLKDVYYIRRQTSPDGEQIVNIIVKKGNEWHGPNRMYLNAPHIVIIESVSAQAKMAQLIKETANPLTLPQTAPPQDAQPKKIAIVPSW